MTLNELSQPQRTGAQGSSIPMVFSSASSPSSVVKHSSSYDCLVLFSSVEYRERSKLNTAVYYYLKVQRSVIQREFFSVQEQGGSDYVDL